jgi:hypothetical protein
MHRGFPNERVRRTFLPGKPDVQLTSFFAPMVYTCAHTGHASLFLDCFYDPSPVKELLAKVRRLRSPEVQFRPAVDERGQRETAALRSSTAM